MGDGDAIGAWPTIAQSRDELGGRRDIGLGFQPEHQAQGAAEVDLLKQSAGARLPDHRPLAERD